MFRLPLLRIRAFTARHALHLPGIDRPRRPDVHADHLATGDLAAAARRRLRRHPAARRPVHAAADDRDADLRTRRLGILSDRYGARPFATGGMLATALSFVCCGCCRSTSRTRRLRAILFLMGFSMGLFASPNRAAVMNSLPPGDRGAGGGDEPDLPEQRAGAVGRDLLLADDRRAGHSLPHTLAQACTHMAYRSPPRTRSARSRRCRSCSLRSSATTRSRASSGRMCCTPSRPTARRCSPAARSSRTDLRTVPYGLHTAFAFAIIACLVAAIASAMRGGVYHHGDDAAQIPPITATRRTRAPSGA